MLVYAHNCFLFKEAINIRGSMSESEELIKILKKKSLSSIPFLGNIANID